MKFPSCPKHFLSYFYAGSLKCHYALPQWQMSKGTRKQQSCFLQWTMPGKCENSLLPLAHSQVLTVTERNSVMSLHTGWNTEYELIKLCMYVYRYSHYLKTSLRGKSCKYFFAFFTTGYQILTAMNTLGYRRLSHAAIIHILCRLIDWDLDGSDKKLNILQKTFL